jgi:PAS domain S-box-containing protein
MGVTSVTMLAAAAEVSERRRIETWIRQLNQGLEQRVEEGAGQLRVINEEIRDQIRHRVMAAEALEHSESRLREAQKVARIGSWEWDIARDVVWWSTALFEIFDVDPEAFGASYEAFLQRVHPDDRERVQDDIQTALRNAQAFSFECRIVRRGGDVFCLHTQGHVIVDDAGQPIRMIGTGQDITERRRLEEERANLIREQAARLEAEAANRSKDDFLATLSHELRNPLNAIVGWARLLRDGRLDPAGKAHAVEAINRNADLQSQLMLDLLDLSRINADRIELRRRRVSLAAVMEAAIETMRPGANARHIALHACIDDHGFEVVGDPDRLQQVVGNLLSNAIHFTPERGKIRVSLTAVDSQASIAIEDDGPGIDPELLPHVFDRFHSGGSRPVKRPGGLGLGLTIVKRLVDLHGGTIRAANVEEGHGAIFRVSLPLAPPNSAETHVQDPSTAVPEPARGLHGLRILVVEDEPDSRELLQMVLSKFGADTRVAGSCAEALARFQERAPDVLISDIGLPDADGYELLARVRALPSDRAVPAIALTAYAGVEHAREALRRGFQAHLAKPFETARLVQLIDELARSIPSPS